MLSVTDRNCETPPTAGFSAEVRGPLLWNPNGNSIIAVSEPAIAHRHTSLVQLHLNTADPDAVLTERLDRNVLLPAPGYPGTVPVLTHDGQHVLFSIRESGWTEIHALSLADGNIKPQLKEANRVYSGLAVAAEAPSLAVIVATGTTFPEIAVMDQTQGTLHNVTTLTDSVLGDRCLTKPIERRFRTGDGTEIHGWLLRREGNSGPGPLLLDIHGGPHNAWTGAAGPAWIYHHELLSRGWSVLTINSRGSDGYGEKFYTALQGKWGFADEPDFLEAIDALVEEGIADPTKLAVAGYSYGGFMTCHLTSRTKRFFAAVAGGSLCDLPALVGAADEGWNVLRYELQADPYNDRKELSAMSPAARAKDVVTPTLLLHGASDSRTPLSQAEEWAALLLGNGTKCELVAYPGEFHALPTKGRPSFRYDYQLRLVTWLEQHLDASERGTRPDAS
ncbi:dipeptidyl aminopeptidase/acylaminoacyl peptidase [Paenarthrobacter nicotinovorans]|uniref:Dipeptidyl aminopeptidase/acylaminoacyl peptidase n=1 Tax=Paenarthrobacter nicotinovorans TaxID=29320 RepID=A0ABT9TTG0_PAENI|nr:prolyl oligopeptidase family serine peptidase [Paenarthrobacter nicotinovorans]MDQ0104366.1 dipeptidyl aminopeptidase/acylaminoacyl peptidase [Paenarthrobacter nicotinovorans]